MNRGGRLTERFSVFHPRLWAMPKIDSDVTLSITFFEFGTTTVTLSPSFLTPMNPLVENSSISDRVLESRCSVIPYPSFDAFSLQRSTGA